MTVGGHAVDFIYRDLVRVEAIVDDCCAGRVEIYYQPGHVHGFVTSIYLAEIATCRVIWDADADVARLKRKASGYPTALKQGLVKKFSWEIEFALAIRARACRVRTWRSQPGCAFRAVACMLQVLFAINEKYWLNEKGAVGTGGEF